MKRLRKHRLRHAPDVPVPFFRAVESEPAWLELGAAEMRLKREDGDVVWSASLADCARTFTTLEWSSGDLATLESAED